MRVFLSIVAVLFIVGCTDKPQRHREEASVPAETSQQEAPEPEQTPEIVDVDTHYTDIWIRNTTGTWELLDSCTDVKEDGQPVSAEGCKSDYSYANLTMPLRMRHRIETEKVTRYR